MVAVLSLSGRAGSTRLRGNVEAGLASPGRVRLEAPGPFGSRPIFVLVARDGKATLLLPRDKRVLRDASPDAIVEALAGVPLDPDQLRSTLAGCGLGPAGTAEGRAFGADWLRLDGGSSGVTHWLRRIDGAWRLAASSSGSLEVRYDRFDSGRPAAVRLRRPAGPSGAATDLRMALSQVDLNVSLEDEAFDVEIPGDAVPMTLDELRRAGPLGNADR
jgi:hypothetical protein